MHRFRRVVRVRFTKHGKTYSYRCRAARKGDRIVVYLDGRFPMKVTVIGYGRRGYLGHLDRAELLPRQSNQNA